MPACPGRTFAAPNPALLGNAFTGSIMPTVGLLPWALGPPCLAGRPEPDPCVRVVPPPRHGPGTAAPPDATA